MPFPTTPILDNFNRGDEGPPPSASWTDVVNGLEVNTNECAGDTVGTNRSYWNIRTFGGNCEGYYTISVHDVGSGIYARQTLPPMDDGYFVNASEWQDKVMIYRNDNGVDTKLGADINQVFANGDKVGIQCIGSSISAWFDDGGAGWGSIGTRTDDTYSAAGSLILYIEAQTGRADDFGGGTIRVPRNPAAYNTLAVY